MWVACGRLWTSALDPPGNRTGPGGAGARLDGRCGGGAPVVQRLTTSMRIGNSTALCSLAETECSPTVLIGSMWICLRSRAMVVCFYLAATTSAAVTEP